MTGAGDVDVLRCGTHGDAVGSLFARFGLEVARVAPRARIPGSYWGAPEAGLSGGRLWLRDDTPVHSALHEGCHYVCMDPPRRAALERDAGGDDAEENAVCCLQILLAGRLAGVGSARMCRDMDRWGYSFRLGSARRWFEEDAGDAFASLRGWGLLDAAGRPCFRLRGGSAGRPDPRRSVTGLRTPAPGSP